MPIISTLGVSIRAKADQFLAAMKKVRGAAKAVIGAFGRMVKSVGKIALAFAGLQGLSLAVIIQQTRKLGDQVGKLADEIGIGVDELLGLRKAAELTGTTTDVLTKGLQRMSRRIGEANAGYGEGVKGLEDMGLAVDDLVGLSAFEQFKAIADSVGQMSSQADKAAAVYTTFGRQGSNLLNMFNLLGAGIDKVTARNMELQGSFERSDLTPIEAMNDRVVDLKSALQGLSLKALIALSPQIAGLVDAFTEGIITLRKKHLPTLLRWQKKIWNFTITAIQKAVVPVAAFGIALREIGRKFVVIGQTMVTGFKEIARWIQLGLNKLNDFSGGSNKLLRELNIQDVSDLFIGLSSAVARGSNVVFEAVGLIIRAWTRIALAGALTSKMVFQSYKTLSSELFDLWVQTSTNIAEVMIAGITPGASVETAYKKAAVAIEKQWATSTKRMNFAAEGVFEPILSELKQFGADAKDLGVRYFEGIGDDIEGVQKLRKLFGGLDEFRDFKLESQLPNIEIAKQDRELLEKLFAPAAEFGSQAAQKIIAESGSITPPPQPKVTVKPAIEIPETKLNFDPPQPPKPPKIVEPDDPSDLLLPDGPIAEAAKKLKFGVESLVGTFDAGSFAMRRVVQEMSPLPRRVAELSMWQAGVATNSVPIVGPITQMIKMFRKTPFFNPPEVRPVDIAPAPVPPKPDAQKDKKQELANEAIPKQNTLLMDLITVTKATPDINFEVMTV